MKERYTLESFIEYYQGFDFEKGKMILFDADLCKQYFIRNKVTKIMYMTPEILSKFVHDWASDKDVITIILKGSGNK